MLIKIQKSKKDEPQSQFFQLKQQTLWRVFFLIIAIITNSQQILLFYFLFSESFTWLLNCFFWVRYPSLGTNYYFWKHGSLVVNQSSVMQCDQIWNRVDTKLVVVGTKTNEKVPKIVVIIEIRLTVITFIRSWRTTTTARVVWVRRR